MTPDKLLERMLDPQIRLGTSTPKADPSGDYAFEVFRKADAVKAGGNDVLSKKALQLTGGPNSAPPPAGRNAYGHVVASGQADIFLTYCTNAIVARSENPGQQVVALPDNLAVGADYGMTVINGASPNAERFVKYMVRQVYIVGGRAENSGEARICGAELIWSFRGATAGREPGMTARERWP